MKTSSSTWASQARRFFHTYNQKFTAWAFVTKPFSHPLVRSYLFLRAGVGVIGVLLPVVLIISMPILDRHWEIWDSMSSYYHTGVRDVFVGSFWAIAIFLIAYRYDHLDDIVSTIAGFCAIGLTLFPTTPDCPITNPDCLTQLQKTIGWIHLSFAASFLSILAFMVLCLFTRGKPKKDKATATQAEKARKRRNKKQCNNVVYWICGAIMVVCIVFAALTVFVPGLNDPEWHHQYHPILIAEFFATEFFGVAWFVKGRTFGMMKVSARRAKRTAQRWFHFMGHTKSSQATMHSQPTLEQLDGSPSGPLQLQ